MKLTEKQRRFADEYIINGNATRAYMNAYPNVVKESTASQAGSRMLRNVKVKTYIDKRLKELNSKAIADQKEIMEYLTSAMRGELTDEELIVVGHGVTAEVERHERRIDINQRTKAAELLGKRYVTTEEDKEYIRTMNELEVTKKKLEIKKLEKDVEVDDTMEDKLENYLEVLGDTIDKT